MDWTEGIRRAIDYIEENLAGEISCEEAAARAFSSPYHFQRVFGIVCGCTFGEYVRKRRLTLAGADLSESKMKVTDAALKYGYETPESFSRAFLKFHGVMPSQAKRGACLRSFSRIALKIDKKGCFEMNYRIEEKPELILTGFRRHFEGVPYGDARERQEDAFFRTTRAKQWLLRGASDTPETEYCVLLDADENGYDFCIAYALDEWSREHLYDPSVTGVGFMEDMGFETLVIPRRLYATFRTPEMRRPILDHVELRRQIVTEWLPSTEYVFADAPEVVAMFWPARGENRYIEIRLPIERKP